MARLQLDRTGNEPFATTIGKIDAMLREQYATLIPATKLEKLDTTGNEPLARLLQRIDGRISALHLAAGITGRTALDKSGNTSWLKILALIDAQVGALYSGVTAVLPNWQAALAAAKAGTAAAVILAFGESTTGGAWGGNPSTAASTNDAHTGAYPHQLQDLFVSAGGLLAAGKNQFGNTGAASITTNAQMKAFNAELKLDAAWVPSAVPDKSMGAYMLTAPASSSPTAYIGYADVTMDTIEVYYPKGPGLATNVAVYIGGAQVGTINQQAATALVARSVFSAAAGIGPIISQNNDPSGPAKFIGIVGYKSVNKGVRVLNGGWFGATSNDLTSGGTVVGQGVLSALAAIAPNISLAIVNEGLNDQLTAVPLATYAANLTTIYNTIKSANPNADVLFVMPNYTGNITQATADAYNGQLKVTAALLGCKVFSIPSISQFATYATAQAAGLMGDNVHPNRLGYAVIAQALYNYLQNPF